MRARERVLRAFEHREADRVPRDFGGTVVTSLVDGAHERLREHLGMADTSPGPIIDYTMGTVSPGEDIMHLFDVDFRRVALRKPVPTIVNNTYSNGFAMVLRRAVPHSYFDVVQHPLAEATVEDLDKMTMPDPDDPEFYAGLAEEARGLYEDGPYCVVADFGVPSLYETGQKLRGYTRFMGDLLAEQRFVRGLFDRLLELQKRFYANYLAAVGKYVQVVGYADDLGMQDRLQMSPQIYREMIAIPPGDLLLHS